MCFFAIFEAMIKKKKRNWKKMEKNIEEEGINLRRKN